MLTDFHCSAEKLKKKKKGKCWQTWFIYTHSINILEHLLGSTRILFQVSSLGMWIHSIQWANLHFLKLILIIFNVVEWFNSFTMLSRKFLNFELDFINWYPWNR